MAKHLTVNNEDEVREIVGLYEGEQPLFVSSNLSGSKIRHNDLTFVIDSSYQPDVFDVTSISSSQFLNQTTLIGLSIGNKITTIGSSAFSGCTGLSGALVIPSSVTSIQASAFINCTGFQELILEDGLTSIGGSAFRYCQFSGPLYIPDTVTTIGLSAFRDCTNISGQMTIPLSVSSVGITAFAGCTGLDKDIVIKGNSIISSNAFQNCTSVKNVYCNMSATNWSTNSLNACGSVTSKLYVTPSYISGYGTVGSTGFRGFPGTLQTWTNYPNPMHET